MGVQKGVQKGVQIGVQIGVQKGGPDGGPGFVYTLVCKRQNQSGSKTFRIRHESGTVSSSVNLVLEKKQTKGKKNITSSVVAQ